MNDRAAAEILKERGLFRPRRTKTKPAPPEMWEKYKNLVWWMAMRYGRMTGIDYHDLVGPCYLAFCRACEGFDESKGSFTTYFNMVCPSYISESLVSESEGAKQLSRTHAGRVESLSVMANTQNRRFIFSPEKNWGLFDLIVGIFDGDAEAMWKAFMAPLNKNRRNRFVKYYKDGLTIDQIAADEGVSRQAVWISLDLGRKEIRRRMLQHSEVAMMAEESGQLDGQT